jgi:hypothetical protein
VASRETGGFGISERGWKRERGRRSKFVADDTGIGDDGVEAGMRNWFGM